MKSKKTFNVWTDGSCRVHTDKTGGWGYVIISPEEEKIHEDAGYVLKTTSPAMELKAVVEGLTWAVNHMGDVDFLVCSDSEVVVKGITQWIPNWLKSNWRTSSGTSVRNKTLWKSLLDIMDVLHVEYKWVKGHDGIKWNEYAHELTENAVPELGTI